MNDERFFIAVGDPDLFHKYFLLKFKVHLAELIEAAFTNGNAPFFMRFDLQLPEGIAPARFFDVPGMKTVGIIVRFFV
jgi:hypothetical protein